MASDKNGSRKRNLPNSEMEAFLTSMTFASEGVGELCDCDEPGCQRASAIPPDIAAAISAYKQSRLIIGNNYDVSNGGSFNLPLTFKPKRLQTRQLIQRDSMDYSIWRLCMPPDSEPLIEFSNTHRLIYIKNLPHNSVLVSIGKGVFGSADEEANRKDTHWQPGHFYFLKSQKGKSLGWIHKHNRRDKQDTESGSTRNDAECTDAEIITFKIDPEAMTIKNECQQQDEKHIWHGIITRISSKYMDCNSNGVCCGVIVNQEDCKELHTSLVEFLN